MDWLVDYTYQVTFEELEKIYKHQIRELKLKRITNG